MRDDISLAQAIGLEGRAGIHQIDNHAGHVECGGKFHGAVQMHDFGIDAFGREMTPRDGRIFGRNTQMRTGCGLVMIAVLTGHPDRAGDGNAASANSKIERRIDVGIVEFHQHIGTANADLRATMRYKSRDIERAYAHHIDLGVERWKTQTACPFTNGAAILKKPCAFQHGAQRLEDTPLWQCQNERRIVQRRVLGIVTGFGGGFGYGIHHDIPVAQSCSVKNRAGARFLSGMQAVSPRAAGPCALATGGMAHAVMTISMARKAGGPATQSAAIR